MLVWRKQAVFLFCAGPNKSHSVWHFSPQWIIVICVCCYMLSDFRSISSYFPTDGLPALNVTGFSNSQTRKSADN